MFLYSVLSFMQTSHISVVLDAKVGQVYRVFARHTCFEAVLFCCVRLLPSDGMLATTNGKRLLFFVATSNRRRYAVSLP